MKKVKEKVTKQIIDQQEKINAIWEFMSDNGWIAFDTSATQILENAYQNDPQGSCTHTLGSYSYDYNFSDMTQVNTQRNLQRTPLEEEIKIVENTPKKTNRKEIFQWIKKIDSRSSENSGYSIENLVGPTKTYPKYGSQVTSWQPFSVGGKEFIEVSYEKKIYPTRAKLYENWNPGACVKVLCKDPKGKWFELWSGDIQKNPGKSIVNEIVFNKEIDFGVNEFRFEFDLSKHTNLYQLEGISLGGYEIFYVQNSISFSNWYMNTNLSDFTFLLKDEKIPAHKFVLARSSSKLLDLTLKQSELKIDYEEESFLHVLKYIYTGRFVLNQKNTHNILRVSDFFDLTELRKACFDSMIENLNKSTVIETLLKAQKKEFDFDATDLIDKCIEFIQEKAYEVFQDESIFLFEKDVMKSLVKGDKISIDEYSLFESLLRWGEKKRGEEDMVTFLKDVVCHIRWPLIDSETLLFKVKNSKYFNQLITDDEYLEALEYNLNPGLFNQKIQKFKPRGSLFKGTQFMTIQHMVALFNMLPPAREWKLIFNGERDGYTAQNFHTNCDKKGPTVVIIQSTMGNVFGGYNPLPWSNSGGYNQDNNGFLFSLSNKEGLGPQKLSKMNGKNGAYSASNYGPTFGSGHDLYLCATFKTNSNYSNLGNCYTPPVSINNSQKKQSFLAGSYNFTVQYIEVYQMIQ